MIKLCLDTYNLVWLICRLLRDLACEVQFNQRNHEYCITYTILIWIVIYAKYFKR